jgi:adenylate cyclase
MIPVVRKGGGFVARMHFDELFVLFGPIFEASSANHVAAAVKTVLDMQNALDVLNEHLAAHGQPRLSMRAGVATETAYVGDIGPAEACDFTAIGPAVNEAKWLEAACKVSGRRNLIDPETRWRFGDGLAFTEVRVDELSGRAFEASSV